MNEQFTPELLAQARAAETPEALAAVAAEKGIALTPEEAQARFDLFRQTGAVSDEELANVAGGCGGIHAVGDGSLYEPKAKFKAGDLVAPVNNYASFYCKDCKALGTGVWGSSLCTCAKVLRIVPQENYSRSFWYELECVLHSKKLDGIVSEEEMKPI